MFMDLNAYFAWLIDHRDGHGVPGLFTPAVGGGDEERHRLSEKGGVQYAQEAYQGRTRALLSRRRPARDVDLAGHASGLRRGAVRRWNQAVYGAISVENASA